MRGKLVTLGMSIPVKRLVLTSVLTAFIFTSLIGFLLILNGGPISNTPGILAGAMVSISLMGVMHISILRYIQKRCQNLPAYKSDILRYSILFLLTLIYSLTVEAISGLFWNASKLNRLKSPHGVLEQVIGASIITILILVTHNQVLLRQKRVDAEIELSKIRAANAEAINLVLQQQIQPHFLFNALNILNSLYKRDYNTGHTYMIHLANFLRATIASTKQHLSTIAEEIKMCKDYVAMQKIRFNDALHFHIQVDPTHLSKGYVPSFSIQPLIENAIKHNELSTENPLEIYLYTEHGYLCVRNNICLKKAPTTSTGQGLANLFKRYELLSGDEVQVTNDSNFFTVKIKILNSEHHHN